MCERELVMSIGENIECTYKNCILIGRDIRAEHDLHLRIKTSEVDIDETLTIERFEELYDCLICMFELFVHSDAELDTDYIIRCAVRTIFIDGEVRVTDERTCYTDVYSNNCHKVAIDIDRDNFWNDL